MGRRCDFSLKLFCCVLKVYIIFQMSTQSTWSHLPSTRCMCTRLLSSMPSTQLTRHFCWGNTCILFTEAYPVMPPTQLMRHVKEIFRSISNISSSSRNLFLFILLSIKIYLNCQTCFPIHMHTYMLPMLTHTPTDALTSTCVRQWSGRPGFNPRSSHTKD